MGQHRATFFAISCNISSEGQQNTIEEYPPFHLVHSCVHSSQQCCSVVQRSRLVSITLEVQRARVFYSVVGLANFLPFLDEKTHATHSIHDGERLSCYEDAPFRVVSLIFEAESGRRCKTQNTKALALYRIMFIFFPSIEQPYSLDGYSCSGILRSSSVPTRTLSVVVAYHTLV